MALRYFSITYANRQKTKILLAGGKTGTGGSDYSDDVYVFDWNKKVWTHVGKMNRGVAIRVGLCFYKGTNSDLDRVKQ